MKVTGVVQTVVAGASGTGNGLWCGSVLLRPWRREGGKPMKTTFYLRLFARKTSTQAIADSMSFQVGEAR